MSVATELTRIQSAKAALKTSIRNKGVSVSDDALISAYPALVDAIETGGGGDTLFETVDAIPTAFSPKTVIKSVDIPEGVTIIYDGAFKGYEELESVTLPSTLEKIGAQAFHSCSKLASPITLPSSVRITGQDTFYGCSSLTYVNIDTYANSYTFDNCPNITTLIIGKNCTSFGNDTFDYGIKGTITVDPENKSFSVVTGCLIYDNRLYLGTPSATIPSDVKFISGGAFRGLTNFTGNITIPSSVKEIDGRAFNGTGITSFSTNDTMTSFKSNIIGDCQNLLSVYIGKAITSFDAIDGYWPNVTSIVVNSENTTYDSRDNCNAVISTSSNQMRKGCTTTVIPSSVTSLGSYCFVKCNIQNIIIPDSVTSFGYETFMDSGLQSITIGTGVTQIPDSCFKGCASLTSIDLPDNVTYIGGGSSGYDGAFIDCTSLTTVKIGTGVERIENYAFNNCTSLSSVTIKATTPPTLGGSNVFANNASGRKIYVPAESVEAYKAASYWINYASDIEAISE